MLKINGFDEAIIGPAMVWREDNLCESLVYDGEKMREILMKHKGMTSEEAREFIEFNIEDAYMGLHTAVIVWPEDEWYVGED